MYPISQNDWNRYTNSILDHGLNVAVLVIAGRLFPGSFDVSDDAPDTYDKLVALFESGRRFVVYKAGSANTIFGDPAVNHHFRAWHDWCHWKGRHDFSMRGELAVHEMQSAHLVTVYGDCETTRHWQHILFADGIGQKLHHQRHGSFPQNQMAFVRQFLEDHPTSAEIRSPISMLRSS
jgi:hypothetical protein